MPAKRTRKTTTTTTKATPKAAHPTKIARDTLGPAPETWNEQGRKLWSDLAANAPWLTRADRLLAETACRSIAAARSQWTVPALAQELRALRAVGLVDDLRRRQREQRKGGR